MACKSLLDAPSNSQGKTSFLLQRAYSLNLCFHEELTLKEFSVTFPCCQQYIYISWVGSFLQHFLLCSESEIIPLTWN